VDKQYIFGRMDPAVQLRSFRDAKQIDFIKQGYKPIFSGVSGEEGSGVLFRWESVPLAYIDYPTLNKMVFSKALWDKLMEHEFIKAALESGSFWGESCHADRDECEVEHVACRITAWWQDEKSHQVMGDFELLDTLPGLACYKLARIGRIGSSTRGFGSLKDIEGGLRLVVPDQYAHVCSDVVLLPACPTSSFSVRENVPRETVERMEEKLREQLVDPGKEDMDVEGWLDSLLHGHIDKRFGALV